MDDNWKVEDDWKVDGNCKDADDGKVEMTVQ